MLLAQEPWYLSTADRGRRRLFPRGIVAVFALAMVLVGWLALPSQSLQERLANAHESDSLTVAYLHAWLNAAPGNWQLRMTLARHQTLLGEHDAALKTLTKVLREGPQRMHTRAEHLRLNVLERMAFKAPRGSAKRAELLNQVAIGISALAASSEDPVTLEAYYHRALAIQAPWLASQVLARMNNLGLSPGLLGDDIDLARVREFARAAIGLGDYRLAASLYWRAFDASRDNAQRRSLLKLVAQAEQSGARLPEFFVALESRLDGLSLSFEQNKWLAALAISANRLDLAERFAKQMLRFSGSLPRYLLAMAELTMHRTWSGIAALAGSLSPITSANASMLVDHQGYGPLVTPGVGFERLPDSTHESENDPLAALIATLLGDSEIPVVKPPKARSRSASEASSNRLSTEIDTNREQIQSTDSSELSHPDSSTIDDPLASLLQSLGELAPTPTMAGHQASGSVAHTDLPRDSVDQPSAAEVLVRTQHADIHPGADQTAGKPRSVKAAPTTLSVVRPPKIEVRSYAADIHDARHFVTGNGELMEDPFEDLGTGDSTSFATLISRLTSTAGQSPTQGNGTKRPTRETPNLPFDDEAYRLAFQIFVANGNLDDALAVARSAIEQVPEHWVWHIRAAEVAEWSDQPIDALAGWHRLATSTDEPRFWKHVERLASGLHDLEKLNDFLQWRLAQYPFDTKSLMRLAENLELQGRPDASIELLQDQLAKDMTGDDFELRQALAGIADRSGDTALLLDVLRDMDLRYGPDPKRAAQQAYVLEVKGRLSAAYDALVAALSIAREPGKHTREDEENTQYWQSLARLAQGLRQPALAIEAHTNMLRLGTYESVHLQDLATLLRPSSPARAAEVVAHGYFRFGDDELADQAIGYWFGAGKAPQVDAFLNELPQAKRAQILGSQAYLKRRGRFYQSSQRLDEALADFISVYRVAPNDMENRAAMIWTLLAKRDGRRLKAAIAQWRNEARSEPALWGPIGAALLALDQPKEALPYFVWQARDSQDYLWWLAYADALDSAGKPDAAWQLRRRAWTKLRTQPAANRPIDPVTRARVVALAMRFSPADEARQLLRGLMRDVAGIVQEQRATASRQEQGGRVSSPAVAQGSAEQAQWIASRLEGDIEQILELPLAGGDLIPASNASEIHTARVAASELVVSYLISKEGSEAARGWLLSRYAHDLSRPAWAELALALSSDDHETLDRLLATISDWLPKLDQVEAQRRLGRYAAAQSLAFSVASARPDDDSAHQKLVDAVLSEAPSAGLSVSSQRQGALAQTVVHLDAGTRFGQHRKLYGFARQTRQSTRDESLLAGMPERVTHIGIGLHTSKPMGSWHVELGARDSVRNAPSARLGVTRIIDPAIDADASLSIGENATESAALTAIGQRDRVQAGLRWNITARDYFRGRVEMARIETQLGTHLANSARASLEYGHRIRMAYPDVTLRAVASQLKIDSQRKSDSLVQQVLPTRIADADDLLLPADGAQIDLYATVGMSAADSYTRGARPFGELGVHHNAVTGTSLSARAGLSSSLYGTDRLTLFAAYNRETTGAGRGSHELGLAYRLYY